MWDCEHCGCQAIAGDIEVCPQCGTPRNQEDVPAEPLPSDASADTVAAVSDREAPQAPSNDGDWGKPNGKSNS